MQKCLDTKWKSPDKKGIAMEDVHQMHSYLSSYNGCSDVFLIYPKIGDSRDAEYKGEKRNETLHVSYVDLFDERGIRPVSQNILRIC